MRSAINLNDLLDEERMFKDFISEINDFSDDVLLDSSLITDKSLIDELRDKNCEVVKVVGKIIDDLKSKERDIISAIKYKKGDYIKVESGDGISYHSIMIYHIIEVNMETGLLIYDLLKVTKGDYINSISLDTYKSTGKLDFPKDVVINDPSDIEFYKKYSELVTREDNAD